MAYLKSMSLARGKQFRQSRRSSLRRRTRTSYASEISDREDESEVMLEEKQEMEKPAQDEEYQDSDGSEMALDKEMEAMDIVPPQGESSAGWELVANGYDELIEFVDKLGKRKSCLWKMDDSSDLKHPPHKPTFFLPVCVSFLRGAFVSTAGKNLSSTFKMRKVGFLMYVASCVIFGAVRSAAEKAFINRIRNELAPEWEEFEKRQRKEREKREKSDWLLMNQKRSSRIHALQQKREDERKEEKSRVKLAVPFTDQASSFLFGPELLCIPNLGE